MSIIPLLVTKTLMATGCACFAELVRRRSARPEVSYTMWLVVLALLILPTLVSIESPEWVQVTASMLLAFETLPTQVLMALVAIWSIGFCCVVARQFFLLHPLDQLVKLADPAPEYVSRQCAAIAAELNIKPVPIVVAANGRFSPFAWHPVTGDAYVVLPQTLVNRFSHEALAAILRHELVHIRRNDAWRHRFELFVVALWWWLPTAWFAHRRLRELEELCADAAVLESSPDSAKLYASTLLDVEEFLSGSYTRHPLAVPTFLRPASLSVRIRHILSASRSAQQARSWRIVNVMMITVMLSLGIVAINIPSATTAQPIAKHGANDPLVVEPTRVPSELNAEQDSHTKEPDAPTVSMHGLNNDSPANSNRQIQKPQPKQIQNINNRKGDSCADNFTA